MNNSFKRVDAHHPLDLYLGEDQDGRNALILISSKLIGKSQVYKGLEVTISRRADFKYVLKFALTSERYKKMFPKLCDDLVESTRNTSVNNPEAIWNQFIRWINLFKETESGLTEEEIRGLIGELILMRDVVIPNYSASVAIASWLGPTGARHDFSLNDKSYEVKTILPNITKVKISSPEQMEPELGKELILSVIHIDQALNLSINSAFHLA